jgi:hypothetical protein
MPARKYKPEGDTSEYDWVRIASAASVAEAKAVRDKLKADPNDLPSRLFLLSRR